MEATANGGVLRFFREWPDPRTGRCVTHKLHELITIAILAVICGADGWTQVALWGKCKRKWLATFLDLPGDIASHDTFSRVFAKLDPDAFERCFLAWMASVVQLSQGRLVAIDGKSVRRSFQRGWDKGGMAHLLSAFVSQGDNRLAFSQAAVAEKSNEIGAIPGLLELLDLRGAMVTLDAIGCQREIAGKIIVGGGNYLLPVKDNQPTLLSKVSGLMDDLVLDHAKAPEQTRVGYHEQTERGHGRVETRRVWVSDDLQWLGEDLPQAWPGLAGGSIALFERVRQDLGDFSGKTSVERQYYICSAGGLDAGAIARYGRGHWSVENNLHWQLDVSFDEDQRRIRKGHGAENYSRLSRIALNLLKRDTSIKAGIKAKRLNAGWDHDYLLRLIST